jgi:hypothetical protein
MSRNPQAGAEAKVIILTGVSGSGKNSAGTSTRPTAAVEVDVSSSPEEIVKEIRARLSL